MRDAWQEAATDYSSHMPHTCRFAAVVFDLDGILIESEAIWDTVRRELAAAEDRPWPDDATAAMMGMSTPEWSGYLATTVGISGTPAEIADRVIDGVAGHYAHHLPAIPGGAAAVRRMAAHHKVGVASSSPRRLIDRVVRELGLADVLTTTVSTEEVAAGKPAPDGYLKACSLLGVDPADAVGVEDSTNGIKSLRNAGMTVIAIPPSFHAPSAETLALADVVIDSLDELTENLLATL